MPTGQHGDGEKGEICEAKPRRRQEVYTVQPRGRHPEIRTLAPMGKVSNSQRIQVRSKTQIYVQYPARTDETENNTTAIR